MADDFTQTLLRHIQLQRTNPENGWLNIPEMASLMGLSASDRRHLGTPLQELLGAGMIEGRFNAAKAVDEYRSIGTIPTPGRDLVEEAVAEVDRRVPAIFTVVFGGRGGKQRHAAWLMGEYPTPLWFTQCGKPVASEAMTEIRRLLVTCPDCNDNLHRFTGVRAMLTAEARR